MEFDPAFDQSKKKLLEKVKLVGQEKERCLKRKLVRDMVFVLTNKKLLSLDTKVLMVS